MRDKFQVTEEISVYSGALKLLKRYDETRNAFEKAKAASVPPEPVPEPVLKKLPEKPELEFKAKSYFTTARWVIRVVTMFGLFALFDFYLIPNSIYIPEYIFPVAGYNFSEVDIAIVAGVILSLLVDCFIVGGIKKREIAGVEVFEKYADEVKNVEAENKKLEEDYAAACEQQKKVEGEAAMTSQLKMQSYRTTMDHIQKDYMKTYSKRVPVSIASIEGLEKKISELEAELAEIEKAVKKPEAEEGSNPFAEIAETEMPEDLHEENEKTLGLDEIISKTGAQKTE